MCRLQKCNSLKCCSQHLQACYKYRICQQTVYGPYRVALHAKEAEDDLCDSTQFRAMYNGKRALEQLSFVQCMTATGGH